VGPRVRVGIHHGCGDIRYDAVSKGYDYYAQGARGDGTPHHHRTLVSGVMEPEGRRYGRFFH